MIGRTLGHYRVVEKLGEGRMGVVYKAQDLHLDRFVAIKMLPPEKVADPERRRRFTQEAKAASALNHPNIIHIYDITVDQDVDFIAMEYVEGKTLEQMIGRRSLRLNDTLKFAVQIADALAKAHAAGIVHRDLKPANIMINEDGTVKVLDFGLAKLTEPVLGDEFAATATAEAVTEKGAIVGTVAYMSPEQAEGKPVDPRSDIFSFGSVLYEMATGRRAFQDDSKIATLSFILHQEPTPVSQVSGGIPQEMEKVIARCLKKDPARRFQTMADLKVTLEELKEESESGKLASRSGAVSGKPHFSKLMVASALAVGVLLVTALIYYMVWYPFRMIPTRTQSLPSTSKQVTFLGNARYPAISPDGKSVAYTTGNPGGETKLILQDVKSMQAIELAKGRGFQESRWSPDSSEFLFVGSIGDPSRAGLFLISRLGGTPRLIEENVIGYCWSRDGTQIAVTNLRRVAFKIIDRQTGSSKEVPLSGIEWIGYIEWSPVSNLLLFCARDQKKKYDIWTVATDGSRQRKVIEGGANQSRAHWSATGEAIYSLGLKGNYADVEKTSVDPKSGEVQGQPTVLMSNLQTEGYLGFSLSSDETRLVYCKHENISNIWLAEITDSGRDKKLQPKPVTKGTASFGRVDLSPDGKWIAVTSKMDGYENLYKMPVEGGKLTQLTFSDTLDFTLTNLRWSPDVRRIAYLSYNQSNQNLLLVDADGNRPRQLNKAKFSDLQEFTWLPDGHILYITGRTKSVILDPDTGEEKPLSLGSSLEEMEYPVYSPDCKRIAFLGTVQSKRGTWVVSLADNSFKLLTGLLIPLQWSSDGKRIFAGDMQRMAKERQYYLVSEPAGGGDPESLVTLPKGMDGYFSLSSNGRKFAYDVSEDKYDIWLIESFDPARRK